MERIAPPNLTALTGMTNEMAEKIKTMGGRGGPVTPTMLANSNSEMLYKNLETFYPGEFTREQIDRWQFEENHWPIEDFLKEYQAQGENYGRNSSR